MEAEPEIIWPTASEVACLVYTAAWLENVDPIDVLTARRTREAHARCYAFLALAHQFPTPPRAALGRCVGDYKTATLARSATLGRNCNWFDLDRLNNVRAAMDWDPMTLEEAQNASLANCGAFMPERPSAPLQPPPPPVEVEAPLDIEPPNIDASAEPVPSLDDLRKAFSPAPAENLPLAPPVRTPPPPPSDRALALAGAAAVMRSMKASKLTGALAPRILDHRQSGVVHMGEPPPGRSALDEREGRK